MNPFGLLLQTERALAVGKKFLFLHISPTGIIRPAYGASCSDDKYGYYVGGWAGSRSTRLLFDDKTRVSHGLLIFNFEDLKITNTGDGDYGRSQSSDAVSGCGKVVNIPTYGTRGVIILLGEDDPNHVLSFKTITIYDKSEQNWYSQLAFGNLP